MVDSTSLQVTDGFRGSAISRAMILSPRSEIMASSDTSSYLQFIVLIYASPPLAFYAIGACTVRRHFAGGIKGPYNVDDRRKAGMTRDFYEDLVGELGQSLPVIIPPTGHARSSANASPGGDAIGGPATSVAYDAMV
jgi:hypothetical protein